MSVDMTPRDAVLDLLSTQGANARFSNHYLPTAVRERVGCRTHEVWEALWGLVGEGLIYLDPEGQAPDNWRWKLSDDGQRAVGGDWEPRDSTGFLRRLDERVPSLDPVARTYIVEALGAFNARCYLACSVMLGVAAERVFNELAESFVQLHNQPSAGLRRATDTRRGVATRFTDLRRHLEPVRSTFPEDLRDVLTFDAVGDLLRIARNEAGHPSGARVDGETARLHLEMAALYIAKMTSLTAHFNRIEEDPTWATDATNG